MFFWIFGQVIQGPLGLGLRGIYGNDIRLKTHSKPVEYQVVCWPLR